MARLFQKKLFDMKKLFIFFAFILLAVSCGHHSGSSGVKTEMDAEKEFTEGLTQSDSTAMLAESDKFIKKLVGGQIDEAVNMLYVLSGSELYEKSAEYTQELVERFQMFDGSTYEMDFYAFTTQGNNDVCYRLSIGEDGQSFIRLTLNPVLIGGKWYLTLKDGSQTSHAMAPEKRINPEALAPEEITLHRD